MNRERDLNVPQYLAQSLAFGRCTITGMNIFQKRKNYQGVLNYSQA